MLKRIFYICYFYVYSRMIFIVIKNLRSILQDSCKYMCIYLKTRGRISLCNWIEQFIGNNF